MVNAKKRARISLVPSRPLGGSRYRGATVPWCGHRQTGAPEGKRRDHIAGFQPTYSYAPGALGRTQQVWLFRERGRVICGTRGRAFQHHRSVAGLAAARGDAYHRLGLFHRRVEPFPACYF